MQRILQKIEQAAAVRDFSVLHGCLQSSGMGKATGRKCGINQLPHQQIVLIGRDPDRAHFSREWHWDNQKR
jgi:hypothetical protein